MARCINDQQTRNIHINFEEFITFYNFFIQLLLWEKSSTNLLCNTSCFTLLHICSSNFVQKSSFTSIDVSQNGANRASKLSFFSFKVNTIISQTAVLLFLSEFLLFIFFDFHLLTWFLTWLLFCLDLYRSVLLGLKLLSLSLDFFLLFFGHMKALFLFLLNSILFYFTNSFLLLFFFSFFIFFFFFNSLLL